MKDTYLKMKEINYFLEFNNTASLFKEDLRMQVDSERNNIAEFLSKSLGGTDGIFYTDKELNKTFQQTEYDAQLFLIALNTNTKWVLSQETKKIKNYTCYKAVKKDSYVGRSGNTKYFTVTAWYTPKIPYSYGPTKYNGLPGLILELTTNQATIYASKIWLKNVEKTIKKPKKGIMITQNRYDSIQRGMAIDFSKKYERN
jgi:GLPGLI family protein